MKNYFCLFSIFLIGLFVGVAHSIDLGIVDLGTTDLESVDLRELEKRHEIFYALRKEHIQKYASRVVDLVGHTSPIYSIRFLKNESFVVTEASDNTARMWNVESGECLYTMRNVVRSKAARVLDVSSDQKLIVGAFNSSEVKLWDPASGQVIKMFNAGVGAVYAVVLSPMGQFMVVGGEGGTGVVWRLVRESFIKACKSLSALEWNLLDTVINSDQAVCLCKHKRYWALYKSMPQEIQDVLAAWVRVGCTDECPAI